MPSNIISRGRQAGLTLIELMVSIAIGMILIAGLATLIASQSATRAEIDRSGFMIENGRYATQAIAGDVQMAGYWGELSTIPALNLLPPVTLFNGLPDPCAATKDNAQASMALHVQGIDGSGALPSCLTSFNHKSGTDVLVVRRVDPDSSDQETAGATDLGKLVGGRLYYQTGLTAGVFGQTLDDGANAALFTRTKRTGGLGKIRKVVTYIYFVSTCSVAANCPDNIPTLKRFEPGQAAPVSLAEGIENLQIDYGIDTNGDGAPDGVDLDGTAVADWTNVVTARIHVLARSADKSPGFTDTKRYDMGTHGAPVTPPAADAGYKRHLFVQSVRVVNPSARRAP